MGPSVGWNSLLMGLFWLKLCSLQMARRGPEWDFGLQGWIGTLRLKQMLFISMYVWVLYLLIMFWAFFFFFVSLSLAAINTNWCLNFDYKFRYTAPLNKVCFWHCRIKGICNLTVTRFIHLLLIFSQTINHRKEMFRFASVFNLFAYTRSGPSGF